MKKVKVICKYCKKEEFVYPSRSKKYVCCSRECLGKLNSKRYNKKIEKECPICGKIFLVKISQYNRRICCSSKCCNKYRSIYKIKENNPNYRAVSIIEDGIIRKDYAKYKYPYRKIAKDILNIENIPNGYVVHHKNCNSNDNRPENLILLPKRSHLLLHKWFGNILIKAIEDGKISREVFFSICNIEQKKFYEQIIDLCVKNQVVIKQGELLENPEEDNQHPSVYRNIYEGSTTNERVLACNDEDSNLDTSALPVIENNGDDIV